MTPASEPGTERHARVAVVTGANRGIGLETCRQLLGRGFRVVMTGRDAAALERARETLGRSAAEQLEAVPMDVTDPTASAARISESQRFGKADVLVNNAAVLLFEQSDVLDPRRWIPPHLRHHPGVISVPRLSC